MNEQTPEISGGYKAVAIITAVVGGIALASAGATAAYGAAHTLARSDRSDRASVSGVTVLEVDANSSDVSIRFDDVREAELSVTGAGGDWVLERDGDTLELRSPGNWWSWGGDWSWFGLGSWDPEAQVELVLPQELAGIDADVKVSAGSLRLDGDFDALAANVMAGSVRIEGTANSVDAQLSAGRAVIDLVDVDAASFEVSAGELIANLDGRAPSDVGVDVSAGSATVTLPDEKYDVRQQVSAGSFDNRLQTSSNTRSTVQVELSAGSITLRPAG